MVLSILTTVTDATSTSSAGGAVPWPWAAAGAVALLIVGAMLNHFLTKKLPSEQIKSASIICTATYCRDLFTPTLHGVQNELEVKYQGAILQNPMVINYRIHNAGNIAANDVYIRVDAAPQDQIISHQFYVSDGVICDRLQQIEATPKLLRYKWSYINSHDSITLVLLVTPCGDPRCVKIGIDGKDVPVAYDEMREDCMLAPRC